MNRTKFISGFAEEIDRYLDYKTVSGYKESSFTFILRQFDRFCAGRGIRDVPFSKEVQMHGLKKRRQRHPLPITQG